MTLPGRPVVPPIVLWPCATLIPTALPWLAPAASVPTKLPTTVLFAARSPLIRMPSDVLNPMTFAAADVAPPIVLP